MTHSPGTATRWAAPGRVNLIGEHTDYNAGFVLPFALDAACSAQVAARADGCVEVRSAQQPGVVRAGIDGLRPEARRGDWADYPLGVVWALRSRGHDLPGVSIKLDSDVPAGAGLSSSAAVVCSVAGALDELAGLSLGAAELLAVTRSAENDYVGAPTGGMDQLVSLRAERGHALFCDMRTLGVEQVPLDLAAAGRTLLVIDTRAPHRHADGEYRRRREGCERAARALDVPALRDVEDLDAALGRLPDDELRRYVRHVVTENARVLRTVELLRAGRLDAIGPLLDASHDSMRDDYRITVPQVDVAVGAMRAAGAFGARMTGGGFGGCVLGLLDATGVDEAVTAVRRAYRDHEFDPPEWFTVDCPAAGAHALEVPA